MPELKIGIQLASLGLPLKEGLRTAAQLGAQAVEIDARTALKPEDMSQTAVRQILKLLDDLNLRVCAVAYPTRRGYDVAEQLEKRVAGTKAAMKMAQALGASVVLNQVGHVPQEPAGTAWEMLVQVLADLGRFGQHYGALLAAETGAESGADLNRLLAALPPGSLGIDYNPGRLVVNNHEPLDAIEQLGPHILHVHASDGVRDLAHGRGVEVPLGRGSVEFPAVLGALEEHNYRGYFTIERRTAEDPVFEIGQAVKYLRNL